jgi:hypothetical protein
MIAKQDYIGAQSLCPNYIAARWAGTTLHPQTGAPVLLLTTDAGNMRFLLSQDCGESIVQTGEQYWLQPAAIRPHRLSDPSHDGESRGARKRSAALISADDGVHLGTTMSLLLIGVAGLTLGLFLYFAMVAVDEAVRLIFGPG